MNNPHLMMTSGTGRNALLGVVGATHRKEVLLMQNIALVLAILSIILSIVYLSNHH